MAGGDKSIFQFNAIDNILDDDIIRMGRNNIDYKMTGANFKKAIRPYSVWAALIKQLAPFTVTSGALELGATYTVTTYVAGDDFSNQELLSGTVNTTGFVFKCINDTPTDYSNGSTLDHDGTPFVVSKYTDDSIAEFVNSFPFNFVFQRFGPGAYKINFAYESLKVQCFLGNSSLPGRVIAYNTYANDGIVLESYNLAGSQVDDIIENMPIEIRGYF